MNSADKQYLDVLAELYNSPMQVKGRNGGTTAHFGKQLVFEDVGNFFPLLVSKTVHFKSIMIELLWFLKGHTNIKYLKDHGVSIWDEWADENGELGPVYGAQWRSWHVPDSVGDGYYIDQISNVIKSLKEQPYGRRHIVSAWNPAEVDSMALPPCHTLFQFHVRATGELDVQLYQRSADWFLGVPFNIASYALLLILVARELGRVPGKLVHSFGDYHLYDNHKDAAKEQLSRAEITDPAMWDLPQVLITAPAETSIFDIEPDDIVLLDYKPMGKIAAPVSK